MSETKPKATTEGLDISNLDDILKFIDENFPEGLRSKRKEDFFEGGCYIGFNLSRYGYTDLLAAECHALRATVARSNHTSLNIKTIMVKNGTKFIPNR